MILAFLRAAQDLTAGPKLDLISLIQFGFVGFVLICILIRRFLVPEWIFRRDEETHAREMASKEARISALEDQNERLQGVVRDQMIPALTRATQVAAEYNEELARRRWTAEHQ